MQLYIRVRGRVLGPFDEQKLRSLATRGQFGKMHEVSEDGASWSRASQFPHLFQAAADGGAAVADGAPPEGRREETDYAGGSRGTASPFSAAAAAPQWHYSVNAQEFGPIEFTHLQAMLNSGRLPPNCLVWTKGMPQWTAAAQVDGLSSIGAAPGGGERYASGFERAAMNSERPTSGDERLSTGVTSQLGDTRPWIIFFAVLVTLGAAGALIAGTFFLIMAAKFSDGSKVLAAAAAGQSAGFLVQGVLSCVTAVMLFSLASKIRDFTYHRSEETLEAALRVGKRLVVFWGVLTLVGLVLLLIFTVFALAVA